MIHQAAPTILRENAIALQCLWGILPISPRKRGTHGHGATSSAREWIGLEPVTEATNWTPDTKKKWHLKLETNTTLADSGNLKPTKRRLQQQMKIYEYQQISWWNGSPKSSFTEVRSFFFGRNHWVVTPLKSVVGPLVPSPTRPVTLR